MKVHRTILSEVILLRPTRHEDHRGWFMESWQSSRYASLGLPTTFAQDNVVRSTRDVLRGLHIQVPQVQGKLVQPLHGDILDVALDVRVGSPTFGRSVAVELRAERGDQLWIPAGFAHGYCVLSDASLVSYKCSTLYAPGQEMTIRWDDPELHIDWPALQPKLSDKDAAGRFLSEISIDELPRYAPRRSERRMSS